MNDFRHSGSPSLIHEWRRENQNRPKANFHYLASIPPTEENASNKTLPCRSKNRVRKETRYMLHVWTMGCLEEPAMCADPFLGVTTK